METKRARCRANVPVGKGKRDLENEISKKADEAEAKKTDEETTKKATNQEGDAPKKEGDFEAFEADASIKPKKLEPGSPEHKAARWEAYLQKGGKWDHSRWSKQYDTNMKNVKHGLAQEQAYRDKFGGSSETIKTNFTNRQIDIHRPDELYSGQLKTGKVSLTKQAKIDIQKDAWLVKDGYTVEYILEKGASKIL